MGEKVQQAFWLCNLSDRVGFLRSYENFDPVVFVQGCIPQFFIKENYHASNNCNHTHCPLAPRSCLIVYHGRIYSCPSGDRGCDNSSSTHSGSSTLTRISYEHCVTFIQYRNFDYATWLFFNLKFAQCSLKANRSYRISFIVEAMNLRSL